MVALDGAWQPPRIVAGDLDALRAALRDTSALTARVETRFDGPTRRGQLESLVHQLAPSATFEVQRGVLAAAFDGPPPVRRAETERSAAPHYDATGVSLRPELERSAGDPAWLLLGQPSIEVQAWRALPAHSAGSCEPLFDALAVSQEQSLAYLEEFLDHADAVLWRLFRAQLEVGLPALVDGLAPYREAKTSADFESVEAWEQHACGHAQWERLTAYTRCGGERGCPVAPRMYLIGGARVGMAEPAQWSDEDCTDVLGQDVPETLRQLGRDAAAAAVSQLDAQWVTLADRLGALTEVYDALEDMCTPRRRRFAKSDLVDAQARLQGIGRALASDTLDEPGAWEVVDSAFFVPGLGNVAQVARFVPPRGSASATALADARGLRQFMLSRSLCRSGYGDLPLAVAVVEPGQRVPSFLGYFYEEELLCADLSLPSAVPVAASSSAAVAEPDSPTTGRAAPAAAPPPMPAPPPPTR